MMKKPYIKYITQYLYLIFWMVPQKAIVQTMGFAIKGLPAQPKRKRKKKEKWKKKQTNDTDTQQNQTWVYLLSSVEEAEENLDKYEKWPQKSAIANTSINKIKTKKSNT